MILRNKTRRYPAFTHFKQKIPALSGENFNFQTNQSVYAIGAMCQDERETTKTPENTGERATGCWHETTIRTKAIETVHQKKMSNREKIRGKNIVRSP